MGELTLRELRELAWMCGLDNRLKAHYPDKPFEKVSTRLHAVNELHGLRLSVDEFSQVARRLKKPI
jgi:hypothetical protein